MKRSGIRSRYRDTGPSPEVVELVRERDRDSCAHCGREIVGRRGYDWSVQHRRPRGSGGDARPETNLPGNLVLLHGSGTTGCHGQVESRRADAQCKGFLIPRESIDRPELHAIEHALHGWCYLLDDGTVSTDPPEAS